MNAPRDVRSYLGPLVPQAPMNPDEIEAWRRRAWREQQVIAIQIDDPRLRWEERELIIQIANRLWGIANRLWGKNENLRRQSV